MSNQKLEDYVKKNGTGKYQVASKKCPHSSCGIPMKMKKNGFYTRVVITITFAGQIRIRRYNVSSVGGQC